MHSATSAFILPHVSNNIWEWSDDLSCCSLYKALGKPQELAEAQILPYFEHSTTDPIPRILKCVCLNVCVCERERTSSQFFSAKYLYLDQLWFPKRLFIITTKSAHPHCGCIPPGHVLARNSHVLHDCCTKHIDATKFTSNFPLCLYCNSPGHFSFYHFAL